MCHINFFKRLHTNTFNEIKKVVAVKNSLRNKVNPTFRHWSTSFQKKCPFPLNVIIIKNIFTNLA